VTGAAWFSNNALQYSNAYHIYMPDMSRLSVQVDLNIKFEYNAITEGGADLKPMFGPGLVGLNNLGNYCYMSSILQAVWGIPAFAQAYIGDTERIMRGAPVDVAADFCAQFAKVGNALVKGACNWATKRWHRASAYPAGDGNRHAACRAWSPHRTVLWRNAVGSHVITRAS
jgi:Ubiquitin carboxyl-terminal hydrolase